MIINSIEDLYNRVSGLVSEYWIDGVDLIAEQGEEINRAFAADLSSDAHDTGLRYGDDWAEFLEEYCTTEKMCEFIACWFVYYDRSEGGEE